MLIISKNKDYYDSAVGLGIDKTIIYNRKNQTIELDFSFIKKNNSNYPTIVIDIYNKFYPYTETYKGLRSVDFVVIGFCGKLYPAFKFNGLNKESNYKEEDSEIIFDRDILIDKLENLNIDKSIIRFYSNGFNKKDKVDLINNWDYIVNMDISNIQREYNTPVFAIECNLKLTYSKQGNLIINPELNNYNFAKIFDPYTAFQEIQMYISGVLASGDNISETKMSEKEKVNQHGFDDKYGFRTRPKKK